MIRLKVVILSHEIHQESCGCLDRWATFFCLEVTIAVVLGYVVIRLNGLKYDFHLVLEGGVRFGLYLGGVIAVLAFIGTPRRGPPFNS